MRMPKKKTYTMALMLTGFMALPSSAFAVTEMLSSFYADPDEFYLFDNTDVEIIDLKKERVVRICVGQAKHAVPLAVDHDGKTSNVHTGNCKLIEGKNFTISPAKKLEEGWDLRGTYELMQ